MRPCGSSGEKPNQFFETQIPNWLFWNADYASSDYSFIQHKTLLQSTGSILTNDTFADKLGSDHTWPGFHFNPWLHLLAAIKKEVGVFQMWNYMLDLVMLITYFCQNIKYLQLKCMSWGLQNQGKNRVWEWEFIHFQVNTPEELLEHCCQFPACYDPLYELCIDTCRLVQASNLDLFSPTRPNNLPKPWVLSFW